MIKATALGFLSIILGQIIGMILLFTIGLIIELLAGKMISNETSLKKFRHFLGYSFIGIGIGALNATMAYLFDFKSWAPTIVFIVYLVVLVPNRKDYVFNSLCEQNEAIFKRCLRTTEFVTFISYFIGLYGLWNILIKF